MQQGTQEWFQARCGLATASRFRDILATIKSGEAASRRNYRAQLVCERLTGTMQDAYQNEAMRWGTDNEPFARIAYEASGNIVQEVGFIKHPTLMAGASPDGLVGDDGAVEIKCPNTATHIETLLHGMPADHIPQVQGQMWITGRAWVDFISYDPRLPEKMQLHVQRIERDEEYIKTLEKEVAKFLAEIDQTIEQLTRKAA
jgi:putative phage-type endonuclease